MGVPRTARTAGVGGRRAGPRRGGIGLRLPRDRRSPAPAPRASRSLRPRAARPTRCPPGARKAASAGGSVVAHRAERRLPPRAARPWSVAVHGERRTGACPRACQGAGWLRAAARYSKGGAGSAARPAEAPPRRRRRAESRSSGRQGGRGRGGRRARGRSDARRAVRLGSAGLADAVAASPPAAPAPQQVHLEEALLRVQEAGGAGDVEAARRRARRARRVPSRSMRTGAARPASARAPVRLRQARAEAGVAGKPPPAAPARPRAAAATVPPRTRGQRLRRLSSRGAPVRPSPEGSAGTADPLSRESVAVARGSSPDSDAAPRDDTYFAFPWLATASAAFFAASGSPR